MLPNVPTDQAKIMTDMTTTMTTSRRAAIIVSIPFRSRHLARKLETLLALKEFFLAGSEACVVTSRTSGGLQELMMEGVGVGFDSHCRRTQQDLL